MSCPAELASRVHADIAAQRNAAIETLSSIDGVGMRPWLWAITRDVETAFVLDTDGYVHVRALGVRPLLPLYDELGRHIDRLAVRVLELAGAIREPR